MVEEIDFDKLARKTREPNSSIEDLDNLYRHVFALPQWYFIARGTFPDVRPYIASNAEVASGQYMIRVFTDTDRLFRFARENKLIAMDSLAEEQVPILSMPTDTIVYYLEQFISQNVHGVWFNSDSKSEGFFAPLKQLRPIEAHLRKLSGTTFS